eukprot:SAG11_NODE_14055_length_627_cov_0.971591_1_plen_98_part_01
MLDSGEPMIAVVVARCLTTPRAGPSRAFLQALVAELAQSEEHAALVWLTAKDNESFTLTAKPSTAGMASAGSSGHSASRPVERPRSMWGLHRSALGAE